MAAKLKAFDIDDCLSGDGVDSELSLLEDEIPRLSQSLGGKLAFSEDNKENGDSEIRNNICSRQLYENSPLVGRGAVFEISSAKVVKQGRDKYVAYAMAISKQLYLITPQNTIQKRYSDFEKLNSALCKTYPHLMKDVSFPKKIISGNFKNETIAQRSRAFEQYLTHINTLEEIVQSLPYQNFFFRERLQKAFSFLHEKEYHASLALLESVVQVQEKILPPSHQDVVKTLCAITAVYNELGEHRKSLYYGEIALKCIGTDDCCRYLVPLLQLTIRSCWMIKKNKEHLEARLAALNYKSEGVSKRHSLLDLVLKQ